MRITAKTTAGAIMDRIDNCKQRGAVGDLSLLAYELVRQRIPRSHTGGLEDCQYTCRVCKSKHETHAEAMACQEQVMEAGPYKVGSIVVIPSEWQSWLGGSDDWIAHTTPADMKAESHFDHCIHHVFYWVVTAMAHGHRGNEHRCHLTVASLGPGEEVRAGWTPAVERTHDIAVPIDVKTGEPNLYDKEVKRIWKFFKMPAELGPTPATVLEAVDHLVETVGESDNLL